MRTTQKTTTIATWNVNSVRARLEPVERFLRAHKPDVLCLQEIKANQNDFPTRFFEQLDYAVLALHGQKMHHGVAILARRDKLTQITRQDWQANGEARHIGARLPNGIRLENVYVPAGGEIPDEARNPKFGQKLQFLQRMTDWAGALSEPTILVGDLNIAPLDCDVWNHKALVDVVSHTPVEIEALSQLQNAHGFVDVGRMIVPAPERLYTWWSYRASNWRESDRGRRLDHVWVSPALAAAATGFKVIEDARSWDKPSDHAPVIASFQF
jgi:exodeoxyribonuclease III